MHSHSVVLGLGSNLDTPLEYLRTALQEIKKINSLKVLNVSSIYESDAQLPENAPAGWNKKYLNAAILCESKGALQPLELLYIVKEIELKMGRLQSEKWAPRTIDIDILCWGDQKLNHPELQLPHPRIAERPFVLLPALEVFPQMQVQSAPPWVNEWIREKPFNTQKSPTCFWPEFVGVLNITSDSFSDGGKMLTSDDLLKHATGMLKAGAEILDFGAESTRPEATFVSNEVEYKNLKWALDVLRPLRKEKDFKVSLDCRHADVVRQILDHHRIDFLNDVSGFNSLEMQSLLKSSKANAFVMHSLSVPVDPKKVFDPSENPIEQLTQWWTKKRKALIEAGITKERLVFDPGIGFGKTKEQNFYILKHLDRFTEIQDSILIGHSRKSYQTLFSNQEASKRDLETALVTKDLNKAYCQFLRVHDVEAQKSALRY